jgi:hypothetical protein
VVLPTTAAYPIRVRVGVLSVIVFALLSSGLEISRYGARFQLLRGALPPEGVVAYLSESRRSPHDLDWSKGFFLTQYALSPWGVMDGIAPALVIGNFPASLTGSAPGSRARPRQEFGRRGLALPPRVEMALTLLVEGPDRCFSE